MAREEIMEDREEVEEEGEGKDQIPDPTKAHCQGRIPVTLREGVQEEVQGAEDVEEHNHLQEGGQEVAGA